MDMRQRLNKAKALINLACSAHNVSEDDICETALAKLKQHLTAAVEPPPEGAGPGSEPQGDT